MRNILRTISQSWVSLVVLFVLLLVLNSAIRSVFFRVDLTGDKRYTLADVTKTYLRDLRESVKIRVYLTGDLNPGFDRLQQATKDLLSEFKVYAGKNLSYSFPEPGKIKDQNAYKKLQKEVQDLNLTPINVVDKGSRGEVSQIPVFPWAVIDAGGKRYPVRLLVNATGKSAEENLNTSIEELEYNLMDGMRIVAAKSVRKIAFLEGQGELDESHVYDMTTSLSHYFQVDRGAISNDPSVLDAYAVVIIAKPTREFSEKDKFVIDQYLMKGGKIIWLVDGVKISVDSLAKGPQTVGIYNNLNLEDMLFTYGVRVNPTLVQDLQCALYPVNFAEPGQKADFHPVPWYYAPLLFGYKNHVITRGLSPVKTEFCSSIDTVGDGKLKKTPLLVTSGHSNVFQAPAPVDLQMAVADVKSEDFKLGPQTVACLVEGTFRSVFRNRFVPKEMDGISGNIIKESKPTSIIVIADGDIIKNEVEGAGSNQRVIPLGYDRFTSQNLFGNRDFLLNCVNYMTDDKGWMELRSRKVTLRLLAKEEANEHRLKWQLVNILLPLFLLLSGGVIFVRIRKGKYTGQQR
ncbi:gliding motility-associated ABC transporter substrate-binding protein GldG [Saccharicrinis sp. FJH54]|uniref:gliding motility-associated ABC transporter substrate-binding protein GldG n=1 Tax=Saccharicrinis sp. FJH54 TaxID=3344665 RepID=UPI0035D3FE03